MTENEQQTNRDEFLATLSNVKRDGMDKLIEWIQTRDFFDAPASTAYHGSYPGGLCEHSLNVYKELKRVLSAFPEIECAEDSAILCALLHDVCKIDFYAQEKRNRKNNEGRWESYDAYKIDEKFCFGGHGSKSVYLIQHFINLSPEEATAINCHMGAFDNERVGNSYEQFPLAWALHVADEAAAYLDETE